MISEKIIKQDTDALLALKQILDDSNFVTEFYPAGDNAPLPILSVSVTTPTSSVPLVASMAFTPFENNELEEIHLLQFSIVIDITITEENKTNLILLSNKINTGLTIGHFTVTDNELWYRYTCCLPKAEIDYAQLLETISLGCVLVFEYEKSFSALAAGTISYAYAAQNCFPSF